MAEVKHPRKQAENEVVVERARGFWDRNNKKIITIASAVILLAGGYLAYKNFYQEPREKKAAEAMYKAEEYFRNDSLRLALSGDGQNWGLEKIISQYGGTKAGNLARFMAGSILVRQGNNAKAEEYLEDFKTDAPQVQARAQKLLADAYGDQGKNKEAMEAYKKSARAFEQDENASSEALFMAAYLADNVLKDKEEAISLFKEIKKKYPRSPFTMDAEKYLAKNGVYSTED